MGEQGLCGLVWFGSLGSENLQRDFCLSVLCDVVILKDLD